MNKSIMPIERIEGKILLIRGQKVIIGNDLADLYGVTSKRLHEQVRRNKERFPEDFMFQLTKDELDEVAAKCGHLSNLRFSSVLPYAFTEHGTMMVANVLNSGQAIEVSVFVIRAFIKLRKTAVMNKQLALKLAELEQKIGAHDQAIISIIDAIKELMVPPEPKKKRPIGFRPSND